MTLERWSVDVGNGGVATLEIPPDPLRRRTFEVSCTLLVTWRGRDRYEDADGDQGAAWHGLRLLVDGVQQWARRVPTHAGPSDSMDYRFRRRLDAGESLRISAASEVHRSSRLQLSLSAEEELA